MSQVVILVPVRGRPHHVAPLLRSIAATTPDPHDVLFLTDPDDGAEKDALGEAGAESCDVDGGYAAKINAGVRVTSEPYVFLGADDLLFHAGWFEAAIAFMDARIGVVGTNDLGNHFVMQGQHSTHSLVARWYTELGTIDDIGKLLHEGYDHNYVDNEFIDTAKHRGAFAHAASSIVEHLHPDWGKAPRDETYIRGRRRFDEDADLFRRRSHLWT